MIYVQLFCHNFFSHTHIMFFSSLFIFLSPLLLINKKKEKQGCHLNCLQMNVHISLLKKKNSFVKSNIFVCNSQINFIDKIVTSNSFFFPTKKKLVETEQR